MKLTSTYATGGFFRLVFQSLELSFWFSALQVPQHVTENFVYGQRKRWQALGGDERFYLWKHAAVLTFPNHGDIPVSWKLFVDVMASN
jgi:hypothetical protein